MGIEAFPFSYFIGCTRQSRFLISWTLFTLIKILLSNSDFPHEILKNNFHFLPYLSEKWLFFIKMHYYWNFYWSVVYLNFDETIFFQETNNKSLVFLMNNENKKYNSFNFFIMSQMENYCINV